MRALPHRRTSHGFTLVELLVALAAMALLAMMSWRGLEAMSNAQASHRSRDDAVLVLQTALAQWQSDLDAAASFGGLPAIDWDGRTLRLTRRTAGDSDVASVYVVAWTLRAGADGSRWWRWQSPPIVTRAEWQQSWNAAGRWNQDGSGQIDAAATPLLPLEAWSLGYFRNNVWTVAGPSDAMGAAKPVPDGLRLVLVMPPNAGLAGTITQDWVQPAHTLAAARGG